MHLSPFAGRSTADVLKSFRENFEALSSRELFSGNVLLARDDEILFQESYGLANRDEDIPNRVDTRFNLGSINKMWTALATMQMVERGQVSLDDNIGRYLGRDWIRPEVGESVQIRHMLSHCSGLANYFHGGFEQSSRRLFKALDDYRPLVCDQTLLFTPGSQTRYSDIGFLLLGVIIEKVSGQSYFDHIRQHLTGPLDMADSEAFDLEEVNRRIAIGYLRAPLNPTAEERAKPLDPTPSAQMTPAERFDRALADQEALIRRGFVWQNNLFMHVVKGGPAGGYYSTAPDMLRFADGLRRHRIVNSATWQLMAAPKAPSTSLGYGTMIDRGSIGHSGNFPGISAQFALFPDGYTLILLANMTNAAGIAQTQLYRRLDW